MQNQNTYRKSLQKNRRRNV